MYKDASVHVLAIDLFCFFGVDVDKLVLFAVTLNDTVSFVDGEDNDTLFPGIERINGKN